MGPFTLGIALITFCAWKRPKTAVPLGVAMAAATTLAVILHL
jgi:hypothetical protein